ncbi:MAG: class I SAM-dependent methyltransferase [Chloroflexota bacterium]|nr:class I SAM-dependent methyltransferase [Chloroflexota bacterium]
MTERHHRALRQTFDEAAERYDRIRPHYLPEVFVDIERLGGLARGSRVLEIGCGTGQATADLALRGYEVAALELGSELAALARANLARFPNVEVIVADFEHWAPPLELFDGVVSATAFHWIDPGVRVVKAADSLRPGGALAIIDTDHVAGGTERFFIEVQDCYERADPETQQGLRLPAAADLTPDLDELKRSGRFGPIAVRQYEWERSYSTAEYVELLGTYSGHIALEPSVHARLLDCIAILIDNRYGGRVDKRYLTTLRVGRRLDEPEVG